MCLLCPSQRHLSIWCLMLSSGSVFHLNFVYISNLSCAYYLPFTSSSWFFYPSTEHFLFIDWMNTSWRKIGPRKTYAYLYLHPHGCCTLSIVRCVTFQKWTQSSRPLVMLSSVQFYYFKALERGGVVGVATCYGLGGPRIESREGRDFPHPSIPALGPTRPPVKWVPSLCLWVKAAGAWRWPPTPSRTEIKERVNLYHYSPSRPSWPNWGWNALLLEDGQSLKGGWFWRLWRLNRNYTRADLNWYRSIDPYFRS
jgi:hypothetical protein